MTKILYLDTETTGLGNNAAIIQMSGIIEIGGEVVEEFNLFSAPHPEAEISEQALEIQRRSLDEILEYPPSLKLYLDIVKIMDKHIKKFDKGDKFVVAGYNVDFDIKKLSELFMRYRNAYLYSYISNGKLDPLHWILPLQLLEKLPKLENNKLETWCKHFNIELKAHDSMEDIRATRELIKIFMDIIGGKR